MNSSTFQAFGVLSVQWPAWHLILLSMGKHEAQLGNLRGSSEVLLLETRCLKYQVIVSYELFERKGSSRSFMRTISGRFITNLGTLAWIE